MKKICTLLSFILLMVSGLMAVENTWTGSFNKYWHNANNWSLGHIPTSTEDVVITSSGYQPVTIDFYNESCHHLSINSGTTLKMLNTYTLDVTGSMTVYGTLLMDNSTTVNIAGNISWESGSSATISNNGCSINVSLNWSTINGSNVYLDNGVVRFIGTGNSYVYTYDADSYFHILVLEKIGSVIYGSGSTQPWKINSSLTVTSTAILKSLSNQSIISYGQIYNSGHIQLDAGTLVLENPYAVTMQINSGDYVNNFTVSTGNTVTLAASSVINFLVKGNLLIESGTLYPVDNILSVQGNWDNQVGTAGFLEGIGRVIFNGSGNHQYCSTETFNIVEVNKASGGALRVNGGTVTCARYDWTAGAVDVLSGTFTANDLVDDGIYGSFYNNAGGVINLTHNDGFVDLNGSLFIYGGEFNVYGGIATSYWPYAANASITMSGGTLDFKNRGININASASYTFSENITSGIIRTVGEFRVYRPEFTPTGGTIEMVGSIDGIVSTIAGSNLNNLSINKGATYNMGMLPDERRNEVNSDAMLTNTVTISSSPLEIKGSVTISQGTLNCGSNTINVGGNWTNSVGTSGFTEGTGKVTFNRYSGFQYCSTETFNIFEINKTYEGVSILTGNTVTCAQYDWNSGSLGVTGGVFTANDLTDNGIFGHIGISLAGIVNLTNSDGPVDLNADIYNDGGILNIYGGTTTSYWANAANTYLYLINGAVIDFKNVGIIIPATIYSFAESIGNSTIRTTGNFTAEIPAFSPSNGTVELYGTGNSYISTTGGSNLYNLIINKGVTSGSNVLTTQSERNADPVDNPMVNAVFLSSSPVYISNEMDIQGGSLDINGKTLEIGGDLIIHAASLIMTTATGIINADNVTWGAGSAENITSGVFNVNGWQFEPGTLAKLGTGNMANVSSLIEYSENYAEFGSLTLITNATSSGSSYAGAGTLVKVMGSMTVSGNGIWINNCNEINSGSVVINNGACLKVSTGYSLTIQNNLQLNGKLEMLSSSVTIHNDLLTYSTSILASTGGTLLNDRNVPSGWLGLTGTYNLDNATSINFPNRNIQIGSVFSGVYPATFKFGQSFQANNPGTYSPTGGTVEFTGGGTGFYVDVTGNNSLWNIKMNKSGTLIIYNHLMVKKDVNLQNGILDANGKTLYVGGDWNNTIGTAGFAEGTGRVIFNGTAAQLCSTEQFNILEIDKGMQFLYNQFGADISCQVYDWTQGGIWIAGTGSFTAFDLADNGMFGYYYLHGGTINITQDDSQSVGLQGNLSIMDGIFNVNGNPSNNHNWACYSNASFTMSGGILDYHNLSIVINETNPAITFAANISGGTIRTANDFFVTRPSFQPLEGTLELYGYSFNGCFLTCNNGSYLHHLLINKIHTVTGMDVVLASNVSVQSVTVNQGALASGSGNIQCYGNFQISDNGWYFSRSGTSILGPNAILNIDNGGFFENYPLSTFKLGNNAVVNVNNGGEIQFFGDNDYRGLLTGIGPTDRYAFNVNSGGTIRASYTVFEQMDNNGINVQPGGMVATDQSFKKCEFRNGSGASGVLLTLNNEQDLIITNALFPANYWGGGYNVRKTVSQGHVFFDNVFGGFAGAAFEQDPNDLITWQGEGLHIYLTGLLEGLYDPATGKMRKAQDENGNHFPGNTADQITVELHNFEDYGVIAFTVNNVNLSTSGSAVISLPAPLSGYKYITIKHRNSIETVSASPILVNDNSALYCFNEASEAFGSNMRQMTDGRWTIFGGDVNQDGIVDSGDMIPVENLASTFASGYIPEDVNGDGLVDSGEMIIVENNSANFVTSITP